MDMVTVRYLSELYLCTLQKPNLPALRSSSAAILYSSKPPQPIRSPLPTSQLQCPLPRKSRSRLTSQRINEHLKPIRKPRLGPDNSKLIRMQTDTTRRHAPKPVSMHAIDQEAVFTLNLAFQTRIPVTARETVGEAIGAGQEVVAAFFFGLHRQG